MFSWSASLSISLSFCLCDALNSHTIDNPDEESEVQLLRAYVPSVHPEIIRRLTRLFADLRKLVDEGLLVYPYSMRCAACSCS